MSSPNPVAERQAAALAESNTVSMFERLAKDPAVDVAKLERLMAMKERADARNAEQLFNAAMAKAQSEMGRVSADKDNSQTKSRYASYAALDRELRPVYTNNGFALSFGTAELSTPDMVRVTCHVSHIAGHSRDYQVDMPADGKGAKGGDVMTKTHATGSAVAYGMRYLLKMIFNVAVGDDDDDDGNRAGASPRLTEDQQKELRDECAALDPTYLGKLLAEYKAGTLGDIPASEYKNCKTLLDNSRKAKARKAAATGGGK